MRKVFPLPLYPPKTEKQKASEKAILYMIFRIKSFVFATSNCWSKKGLTAMQDAPIIKQILGPAEKFKYFSRSLNFCHAPKKS